MPNSKSFKTYKEAEDYFYKQGALSPEYIGLFSLFQWYVVFYEPTDLAEICRLENLEVIKVMGNI